MWRVDGDVGPRHLGVGRPRRPRGRRGVRHVEISPSADGGYSVRDVGSLNGTYVNRERIDEVPLAPGDEVQIGKFKLVYLVAGNE